MRRLFLIVWVRNYYKLGRVCWEMELKELYKETNEKFIGRVQNMLYEICGVDKKRAREVLEECLKRNEKRKY